MKRIEKIELGLFEIARECRTIDRVATNCATLNGLLKNGRYKVENLLKLPEEHEDFLKDVHGKVAELLEMVGEYMNDHEMIEAVDLAINTPIYDLVYERKTEDDFEKEATMETIRVTVAKCGKNYAASLSDNVPGAVVLTADTYEELQQKTPEVLKFHVDGMIADGDDVPDWLRNGDYKFEYDMLPKEK